MNFSGFLRDNGIKATRVRIRLLDILYEAQYPIQQKEIERRWGEDIDRVTLYRNLKTLSNLSIIHKIEVSESVTSYKLSSHNYLGKQYAEHAHFHCAVCNKVICMPQYKVGEYQMPEGFKQIKSKIIIEGVCKWCNNQKS